METKTCRKCGTEKEITAFQLGKGTRRSRCKECVAAYVREYHAAHPRGMPRQAILERRNAKVRRVGDVVYIPLTRGYEVVVDAADAAALLRYMWTAAPIPNGTCYARRHERRGRGGKLRVIYMHRAILSAPPEALVDHINGNGLDNRRSNLRLADKGQNRSNSSFVKSATGFKGVVFSRGKYTAYIVHEGRQRYIGRFESAEAAARAYDTKACELFGEFARTNFK